MLKITPMIRNAALASTVALAAIGTASCSKVNSGESVKAETILQSQKPMDFTKPNLLVIDGDKVTYRNVDGDVVEIENRLRTHSLYKAINKYSTVENPNIDDVEGFYCEVEKNNIPTYGQNKDLSARSTILLKNLYDMFTAPDSEGGKTITVKEYTHMMEAWSSAY